MPGVVISSYQNPLDPINGAPPGIGLPIIDVFRDIIDVEATSAAPFRAPANATVDDLRARDPATGERVNRPFSMRRNRYADLEAAAIRDARTRNDETYVDTNPPDTPGRTFLKDVTWAFNQATGARPEAREIDPHWMPPEDPDHLDDDAGPDGQPIVHVDDSTRWQVTADAPGTHEIVYSINPRLPSLNRQPGIIFVPAGLFYLFGTMTLYGGQILVGVGGLDGGSVLVKVGDGACIRTENQLSRADDPQRTDEGVLGLYFAESPAARAYLDRTRSLLAELERRLDASPPLHGAERRKDELVREFLSSDYLGYATVRIGALLIRQRDGGAASRKARGISHDLPPNQEGDQGPRSVPDHVGDWRVPSATLAVRDFRPLPLPYSSVAIDCRGMALGIVEDVTIRDFTKGVGIQISSRNPGPSQAAYYNQIRRCDIGGCERGILLQWTLGVQRTGQGGEAGGPEDVDPNAGEAPELHALVNGGNSTIITECTVHDYTKAGIEVWGPTIWITFTRITGKAVPAGAEPVPCVVLPVARCMVYRCRLASNDVHVVAPASTFPEADPTRQHDQMDPGAALSGHLSMHTSLSAGTARAIVHCDFTDVAGHTVEPRVASLEFAHHGRLPIEPVRRLGSVWDQPGGSGSEAPIVEVAGVQLSPESFWTGDNLLSNVGFGVSGPIPPPQRRPPAPWTWHFPDRAWIPAVEYGWISEPEFTGPVITVTFGLGLGGRWPRQQVETNQAPRLEQLIVPGRLSAIDSPEELRAAWAARSAIRGRRLVAGCWVHANYAGAVSLVFREGGEVSGGRVTDRARRDAPKGRHAWNWRPGSWLFVTGFHDPNEADFTFADMQPGQPDLEIAFNIVFNPPFADLDLPPDGQPATITIGGPQVSVGPELFPLGPRVVARATTMAGPIETALGAPSTHLVRIVRERRGSAPVGSDGRVEDLTVLPMPGVERLAGRYAVEIRRGSECLQKKSNSFLATPDLFLPAATFIAVGESEAANALRVRRAVDDRVTPPTGSSVLTAAAFQQLTGDTSDVSTINSQVQTFDVGSEDFSFTKLSLSVHLDPVLTRTSDVDSLMRAQTALARAALLWGLSDKMLNGDGLAPNPNGLSNLSIVSPYSDFTLSSSAGATGTDSLLREVFRLKSRATCGGTPFSSGPDAFVTSDRVIRRLVDAQFKLGTTPEFRPCPLAGGTECYYLYGIPVLPGPVAEDESTGDQSSIYAVKLRGEAGIKIAHLGGRSEDYGITVEQLPKNPFLGGHGILVQGYYALIIPEPRSFVRLSGIDISGDFAA